MFGKAAMFGRTLEQVLVDRTIGTRFGNMTDGSGLAGAYDGNTAQDWGSSCRKNNASTGYVGKSYSSAFVFGKAKLYPSTTEGFSTVANITLSIYGKNGSNPANGTDGTLLGTTGLIADTLSPVEILSTDEATAYDRIWLYMSNGGNVSLSEIELYQLL